MEITKVELASIEESLPQSPSVGAVELNDLQLALVGGGMGETTAI
jgi:hypothetical protein